MSVSRFCSFSRREPILPNEIGRNKEAVARVYPRFSSATRGNWSKTRVSRAADPPRRLNPSSRFPPPCFFNFRRRKRALELPPRLDFRREEQDSRYTLVFLLSFRGEFKLFLAVLNLILISSIGRYRNETKIEWIYQPIGENCWKSL